MFIGSAEGGVEIEQVAVDNPDAIVYEHADPLLGLPDYAARELAFKIGFGRPLEGRRRDRQGPAADDARESTRTSSRSTRWP